jgi:amino acid transporter
MDSSKPAYAQELRRGISGFTSFTLCFTNAAIIPALFMQMDYGFRTGGPAVMLYGWLIVGLFTVITGSVMAEICSTYPVSGSVYYWAGALAKPEDAAFASYLTGWANFCGGFSFLVTISFGLARILVGLLKMNYQVMATNGMIDREEDVGLTVAIAISLSTVWCLQNLKRIDD